MWKKINDFMTKHSLHSISIIAVISLVNFATNLITSFNNGTLTDAKLHELLASADGFQAILIGLGMIYLQFNSKD